MLSFLLQFRIKQAYRTLGEIGIIRFLILVPFLFIILMVLLEQLVKATPFQLVGLFSFFLISTHLAREDKRFLGQIFKQPAGVYSLEYLMLFSPIFVWLAYKMAWAAIVVFLGVIGVVAFVPWTLKFQDTNVTVHFPKWMHQDFEWLIGIRKQGVWIVLIYGIAMVTSFYTVSVLAALLLLAILVTTFYLENGEERIFLQLYATNPKQLMRKKVVRSVGLFWLFTSPLSVAFLIFHYQYWYLLLAILVISSIIQLTSVTLKYATYAPKETLQQNSWILGLLLACWLAPFFQPVPLLMTIVYYRKALGRLRQFY